MRLEFQLVCAVGLDCALGDPPWLPHPVRGIGWLAARGERACRAVLGNTRLAGMVAAGGVCALTGLAAWGALHLAGRVHPWAADGVAILVMYSSMAARDLAGHAMAVFRPLAANDLAGARRSVAMIVGRDTQNLDEAGVVRAAVESVAESTVDGVTAPLAFALALGPIGAIVYRAVNTLDSLFGHKDGGYLEFGWASARLDDLANLLPARLTAPLMALGAAACGFPARAVWRTVRRDARRHESPNAGFAEAAMAGALGVQLGGLNYYGGQALWKPTIGEPTMPLRPHHIRAAICVMAATAVLFLGAGILARLAAAGIISSFGGIG